MLRGRFSFLGLAALASLLLFSYSLIADSRSLPELKTHPLPANLAQWQEQNQSGDYFDAVEISPVGALIWSQFPVKIYIQSDRSSWLSLVQQAIAEWGQYLPIELVNRAELADILIKRELPPSGVRFNPETGKLELPRVRSAITQYEIFVKENRLTHRMSIQISPNLADRSALAAARHELGHALGIWGHSPLETDVMYFAQTRDIAPISSRDINTLKKVYQQPTKLGWQMDQLGYLMPE
jgi:predicted Zn-dependent protease